MKRNIIVLLFFLLITSLSDINAKKRNHRSIQPTRDPLTCYQRMYHNAIANSIHRLLPAYIKAKQHQFTKIYDDTIKCVKEFGNAKLVAMQAERNSRPLEKRKLLHDRLDKLEETLKQLDIKHKNMALTNLKSRTRILYYLQ